LIGRENEIRNYRDRVGLFTVLMIAAMSVLISRLFFLQILNGEDLRRFSESNRLKKERLAPTRGVIYDRQGRVIVDNRAAFDVILLSQYYPFTPEVDARLAKALQMPPEELEKRLSKARKSKTFHPVLLKADVPKDVVAAISMDAEGFPGIDVEATVQRRYPYGEMAAQLLGYIGEVDTSDMRGNAALQLGDTIGKMGLERTFDKDLRGVNGIGYVEVDARGRRRLTQEGQRLLGYVTREDPQPGDNLHLTIDIDLEAAAAAAMEARQFYGSVVAMDPRSGEVLALVNTPAYHPGKISGREVDSEIWRALSQSEHRPLRNRAIQDHYPPGSTFKLFLALAALKEGIATKNTTVNCRGGMKFGSRRFNCWKTHGTVDFVGAIRESCDVFFYQMGIQLGIDRIAEYARLFGFGSQTGIGVSGEQKGHIPDSVWKQKRFNEPWQPGETLSVAIGQGYVDVTPIQLVSAFAAIGNEGFLYRPHLIRRVEKTSGQLVKEFTPELLRRIELDPAVFGAVKDGLFEVVNNMKGTGIRSRSVKTVLSGKTGTSQVRAFANIMSKKCEKMDYKDRHHGWFVGYAPRDNPEIAVVAIAEHSCHGSLAGPVVKDVVEAYFDKKASLVAGPSLAPVPMKTIQPVSNTADQNRRVATPALPTTVDETREE
jgi:penicillin-binding protein 2